MNHSHERPERTATGAFSEEAKANVFGFLECVREIVDELLGQGFTIVDGKLVPPLPDHR